METEPTRLSDILFWLVPGDKNSKTLTSFINTDLGCSGSKREPLSDNEVEEKHLLDCDSVLCNLFLKKSSKEVRQTLVDFCLGGLLTRRSIPTYTVLENCREQLLEWKGKRLLKLTKQLLRWRKIVALLATARKEYERLGPREGAERLKEEFGELKENVYLRTSIAEWRRDGKELVESVPEARVVVDQLLELQTMRDRLQWKINALARGEYCCGVPQSFWDAIDESHRLYLLAETPKGQVLGVWDCLLKALPKEEQVLGKLRKFEKQLEAWEEAATELHRYYDSNPVVAEAAEPYWEKLKTLGIGESQVVSGAWEKGGAFIVEFERADDDHFNLWVYTPTRGGWADRHLVEERLRASSVICYRGVPRTKVLARSQRKEVDVWTGKYGSELSKARTRQYGLIQALLQLAAGKPSPPLWRSGEAACARLLRSV